MTNEKTIKQLADELGVSKQAIRKHIDKLPPTLLVTKKGNTIFLSTEIVNYIQGKVKKKDTVSEKKVTSNVDSNFKSLTGNKEEVFSNLGNDFLEKQLLAKDKQLEEKDNQIKALHKLLDQQQILTLQANKKIEELELKSNEGESQKKENEFSFSEEQEEKQEMKKEDSFFKKNVPGTSDKKNFWARWFKK